MCLYPKIIENRKYKANKKNGGIIPAITDKRVLYVPVGCGKCMECKKQKSRQWQVRLQEDIRINKNAQFVTLTFNNESIQKLSKEIQGLEGYERENEIAKLAVKRFRERWRKKYGKSIRHWLVTELGHQGTENIHLHGLLWTNEIKEIEKKWQYGYIWTGEYVNEKTINYITKYINKTDQLHKEYNSITLTSAGIGNNYINRHDSTLNKYQKEKTKETYTTRQGIKINLPIYYRNKIYTEEEREKLWLEKLDKQIRWINGKKIDISKGDEEYYKILYEERKLNKRLGYGSNEINWERKRYEREKSKLNHKKRIQNKK